MQTASSSNQLKVHTQTLWHFSILRFLISVFYRVYGQWSVCWPTVNQREGQIITEYLAVVVESRMKCETTHTSPGILTDEKASRLEPTVNQREGQIITEYLAVVVESRIKCETTHTSPGILTDEKASRLEPRL